MQLSNFLVSTLFLLVNSANLLQTSPIQAQENRSLNETIPKVSLVPLAKMKDLSVLSGYWDMEVFITQDNGKSWQSTPKQSVSIIAGHKGMMLEERPMNLNSPGFHMHSFITYDQYRKVYRKAAVDDVWGIMDLYEGKIEDGKLIMTNLRAKTFFPVAENVWRGFRLIIELESPQRSMLIEKTDDNGKTWQAAFKVEYRLKSS